MKGLLRFSVAGLLFIFVAASQCVDEVSNLPITLNISQNVSLSGDTNIVVKAEVLNPNTEAAFRDNKNKIESVEIERILASTVDLNQQGGTQLVSGLISIGHPDSAGSALIDSISNVDLRTMNDKVLTLNPTQVAALGTLLKTSDSGVKLYYRAKVDRKPFSATLKFTFRIKVKLNP